MFCLHQKTNHQTIILLTWGIESGFKKEKLGSHHGASPSRCKLLRPCCWASRSRMPARRTLICIWNKALSKQRNEMYAGSSVWWDELGYAKWSWNVRRGTWLSPSGSESKEFRREQPESRGRWCKRDLRRDGPNLQTLPASSLSHGWS